MAKKITRGITGIKEINKQDFDTNNVNDLLSDGQYNYIHRKKGKSEEYHNLTDNIKTISSDNTDLLAVTNNNKTTNSATLHPKHDSQKEQVLESERATITIKHGTNATPEKTKVDTNPQKVLEHSNLQGNTDFVKIQHSSGEETTLINSEKITEKFNNVDSALLSKQNKIGTTLSVGVSTVGGLRQLYSYPQKFTTTNGVLKTHLKSISNFASVETPEHEFNFIVKINQGNQSPTFTLDGEAKTKFNNIMTTYGDGNTVNINGCDFTLSGNNLTVSPSQTTEKNQVITFSDII